MNKDFPKYRFAAVLCIFMFDMNMLFAQQPHQRDSLLQQLKTLPDDTNKAICLRKIAITYNGNNVDSMLYYSDSLQTLSEKIQYAAGQFHALNMQGGVYFQKGELEKSLSIFEKAHSLGEAMGYKKGARMALNNISNILTRLKQYDKALVNYKKILADMKEANDVRTMVYPLMNISVIYHETKQYDSAHYYNDEARKIALEANEFVAFVSLLTNKGNIYGSQEKYAEANRFHTEALKVATEKNLTDRLSSAKLNLAKTKAKLGKHAEAVPLLEEVLGKSDTGFVNHVTMLDTYYSLIEGYEALGKYDLAFKNMKTYVELKNKSYTDSVAARVNEFNTKYETELKNNEIALLKKDTELKEFALGKQQQQKNFAFAGIGLLVLFGGFTYHRYLQRKKLSEQLATSLQELKTTQQQVIKVEKEKEAEKLRVRISRDIHDDIGSHLSKMALHSELISAGHISDERELKHSLQNIAENSRTVINSLGEIVWAVSPAQDSLQSLLDYMRRHLDKFLSDTTITAHIDFPQQVDDIPLMPDVKRNVFLVFKEAVNNTLKYAQAQNLYITFRNNGYNFELTIRDDGKGFPVSESLGKGNGMNNMRERMKQINGTLEMQSSTGNGCTITARGVLA